MSMETFFLSLGESHGAMPDDFRPQKLTSKPKEKQDPVDDNNGCHDTGWILLCKDSTETDKESAISSLIQQELTETTRSPPSLQRLCLKALAKALPSYINENGIDVMRSYLSMLHSWTLSALSMECSRQGTMTVNVAPAIGHDDSVQRLSIVMTPNDDTTESLSNLTFLSQPHSLKRLELGNIHIQASVLRSILNRSSAGVTHLSLGSCTLSDDDDAFHLISILSNSLKILDLSGNDWVTDEWLETFMKKHANHLHNINVAACRNVTCNLLLQLNLAFRGHPLISTKRQRLSTTR